MLKMEILLVIALAPLLGAIVAGLFGRQIGRAGAHTVTILAVAVSCVLSIDTLIKLWNGSADPFNQNVYTFFEVGGKTPPAPTSPTAAAAAVRTGGAS